VSLDAGTVDVLREFRRKQVDNQSALGDICTETCHVFTSATGCRSTRQHDGADGADGEHHPDATALWTDSAARAVLARGDRERGEPQASMSLTWGYSSRLSESNR
jgi:hypothetical protein